jgi:predicted nucleic acid-binding protein
MTIHVDTSALIDALTGPRRSLDALIRLTSEGHRLAVSALVLYEWQRGPRTAEELAAQEELFPSDETVSFGAVESNVAARLYKETRRPRGRELDLAIAACAQVAGAALWTLNPADFRDIPGVRLV